MNKKITIRFGIIGMLLVAGVATHLWTTKEERKISGCWVELRTGTLWRFYSDRTLQVGNLFYFAPKELSKPIKQPMKISSEIQVPYQALMKRSKDKPFDLYLIDSLFFTGHTNKERAFDYARGYWSVETPNKLRVNIHRIEIDEPERLSQQTSFILNEMYDVEFTIFTDAIGYLGQNYMMQDVRVGEAMVWKGTGNQEGFQTSFVKPNKQIEAEFNKR